MRKCRLCAIEKPLARFTWRKDSGNYRSECKDCLNLKKRNSENYGKWHKENKGRVKAYMRNYDLQRKYGISVEDYDALFKKQNKKCAICKTSKFRGKGQKPHVDHCHKSGVIRGLLCTQCNVSLGSFFDNIEYLRQAIKYLEAEPQVAAKYGDTK